MTDSVQSTAQNPVFSNNQLNVEDIPNLQTLALLPISKKYRAINIFSIGLIALVLLSIATGIKYQPFWSIPEDLLKAYPYIVTAIVALATIWALYHVFADVRIFYAIREQDISKQSGLIFRKLSCQPILRVQHVEVNRLGLLLYKCFQPVEKCTPLRYQGLRWTKRNSYGNLF